MFDAVRNNKRLVQIFLAAITLPFAFWGVESYVRNNTGSEFVAKVGDSRISVAEFQNALREQQEQARAKLGASYDATVFDKPEVRKAILDELITKRLLQLNVAESRLSVTDQQLASVITGAPQFQEDGKFSAAAYQRFAASKGLSAKGMDAQLRQDIAMQETILAVGQTSVIPKASGDRWLSASLEQREVSEVGIRPDAFVSQVTLAADAADKYYEANRKQFELPEQIRFEYVVLSQKAFEQKAVPTDAEIKAWYDSHQDKFKAAEERKASHILIKAEQGAAPDAVKAAEAKANEVLALVKKSPSDFAKLAKQYSQDAGSAQNGGDVGVVSPDMVKPFVDAVVALKEGEVSGVVRSEFGFHIIKLTSAKGGKVKSLADAKAEIAAELKTQNAAKKFAEAADSFSEMVYTQSDSLQPVVDKFGLKTEQTPWLPKGQQVPGLSPKVIAALFSDDAIKNKRNTAAIEVAPGILMSARIVEHKPATVLALKDVQAEVEKKLKRDEAAKLALKDAEAKLAKLQSGDASAVSAWTNTRTIVRAAPQGLTPEGARAVFRVDAAKLPGYTTATWPDGTAVLYRVSKVVPFTPADKDDEKAGKLRQQYNQIAARAEFDSWLKSLRSKHKIEINNKLLEAKESDAAK